MADMHISSDRGLEWGNIVITPQELADHIIGIDIVDELLVIDGVKFVNFADREYIQDQQGTKHKMLDLLERIQNGKLH
jgi:hypothetical protein